MAVETVYRLCPFCEACCGLAVDVDRETSEVLSIKGDKENPFSKGFLCPKSQGLALLEEDPDRLRRPLIRQGGDFEETDLDTAIAYAADRIAAVRKASGADAFGLYLGNPVAHNLGLVAYGGLFALTVPTRNMFTAGTIDHIAKVVSSVEMFGCEASVAVPDIDRTMHIVIIGANPMVSNGSLVTAPGWPRRLESLKARGGHIVVIDPRRTETAAVAHEHHFIRPATDALLLFAMVNVLFGENLVVLGRLETHVAGVETLERLARPFTPDAVAPRTGIAASEIRRLARDLAAAPAAVVYGRIGTCTQEFGTLTSWLIDVLNVLTGNLDREGGAMFPTPVTPSLIYNQAIVDGVSPNNRWHSRVKSLPEVSGFLPAAVMADEILTPGAGQMRGLLTLCGNPLRSVPNSARMTQAFASLDFLGSLDFYVNETTRHAHVIIPPAGHLDQAHYPPFSPPYMVRSYAKWDDAVFTPENARSDGDILLAINARVLGTTPDALEAQALQGLVEQTVATKHNVLDGRSTDQIMADLQKEEGAARFIDFYMRTGPFGDWFGARPDGLSIAKLRGHQHGVDLGPMTARIPAILQTASGKIELAPKLIATDVDRLLSRLHDDRGASSLSLVGRRHLRSNNSWMHNVKALAKGPDRTGLFMHPADAGDRGLASGDSAVVRTNKAEIVAKVEITDEIMPGVVSLPHGFGHDDSKARLSVASRNPGANINALTDEDAYDIPSGIAVLTGIAVEVQPVP